jgi:malate dehydrogenase
MNKPVKKIAITGGGGQIAYSLLFRIARGELFSDKDPIALYIYDLKEMCDTILPGLVMELEDCCSPIVQEIKISSDLEEVFNEVDCAILLGSKPRQAGMERKDLLLDNGKIFVEQGRVLNKVAKKDCKVFVVGNPCNTNCLIAMHNAPNIPRTSFHAMTRLDQNRASFQIATKAKVPISAISNMIIWGNHSATQVPDISNIKIYEENAKKYITDSNWLKTDFISGVQKRGSKIIAARGKSSAASAANSIIDWIKSLYSTTPQGDCFSSAVCSDNNPYKIKNDLIFSFPCRSNGDCDYSIVPGFTWDKFIEEKISLSEKELLEEKDMVSHLL